MLTTMESLVWTVYETRLPHLARIVSSIRSLVLRCAILAGLSASFFQREALIREGLQKIKTWSRF